MEETKEIVICWDCSEPIKEFYSMTVDTVESIDICICGNTMCLRYGLASIYYKTKLPKGGTNG